MMKSIEIKNVVIGEGAPKVCIPMTGENVSELLEEAKHLREIAFDIVEWRVDFFSEVNDLDKVPEILKKIRDILIHKPIIFTFRSAKEGGQKEISTEYYLELNKAVIASKLVDIIDVELYMGEEVVKLLIEEAHKNSISVIVSNHDFKSTPSKEEIISRLRKAQELGADLPKIAVMPNSSKDVLTLMDATRIMSEEFSETPIITMSMDGKGIISRLSGEIFGSAVTFGTAVKASAPGQIPAGELSKIIELIHENL